MQNQPPTPEDDEASAAEQETDSTPRPSSPFSETRAARIRRSGGPRISGAIPGRAPLPGSEPPAPPPSPSRPVAAPVRRPSGPRTYAHIMAGLCYLAPPVAPAVILFSPPAHRFARFHALQALALFVVGVTLSFLLSLFTPTNIILGILYFLLVVAIIALLLLWMAAAIGSFEGFAVPLPLLDHVIPRVDDLEEDPNMRGTNPRSALELGIAAGGSALLLILTIWLPLGGAFSRLSSKNLAAIGLNSGLPLWMIVSSLLFSLIFAAIGLTALAVLILGLRKGKFLPSLASGAAVVGSALVATGTGMLIAETLQRSLYGKLVQQFQDMVSAKPLPSTGPDGDIFLQAIRSGREAIQAMDPAQHSLLIPGVALLVLGLAVMLFLLSQLYYKK
jgi:uncharacterized membrane protein